MSTSFNVLPKTLQLFIRLEMKVARFPCEFNDHSQVDFGPEPNEYRPLVNDLVHLLDHGIGIVVQRYNTGPMLRLSKAGQSLSKELTEWDKAYFPVKKVPV